MKLAKARRWLMIEAKVYSMLTTVAIFAMIRLCPSEMAYWMK